MDTINLGTFIVPGDLTAIVGLLEAMNYRVVLVSDQGVVSAIATPSTPEIEKALSVQTPPSQLGLSVPAAGSARAQVATP